MSDAAQSRYDPEVTSFSENELQRLLEVSNPPICLLGGWAVHIHVTDDFEAVQGRPYIGSRDIDLGVDVQPVWDAATLRSKPVATTLANIEEDLEYNRGRFGFYQCFHRQTGDPLNDDEAQNYPQHQLFRVDVDVLPSTDELDAFEEAFGFRPPSDPLLESVFEDEQAAVLNDHVPWEAPEDVGLVTRPILAAMKVRAFPDRDESHKRLKDLADLHALVWYGTEFNEIKEEVQRRLNSDDISRFHEQMDSESLSAAADLVSVNPDVVKNSLRELLR